MRPEREYFLHPLFSFNSIFDKEYETGLLTLSPFLLNLFRLIQIVLGSFSISVNLVAFLLLEQSRQWYLSLSVSFSALKKSSRHFFSSTWSYLVAALMIGTFKKKYFSDCSICVKFFLCFFISNTLLYVPDILLVYLESSLEVWTLD